MVVSCSKLSPVTCNKNFYYLYICQFVRCCVCSFVSCLKNLDLIGWKLPSHFILKENVPFSKAFIMELVERLEKGYYTPKLSIQWSKFRNTQKENYILISIFKIYTVISTIGSWPLITITLGNIHCSSLLSNDCFPHPFPPCPLSPSPDTTSK